MAKPCAVLWDIGATNATNPRRSRAAAPGGQTWGIGATATLDYQCGKIREAVGNRLPGAERGFGCTHENGSATGSNRGTQILWRLINRGDGGSFGYRTCDCGTRLEDGDGLAKKTVGIVSGFSSLCLRVFVPSW